MEIYIVAGVISLLLLFIGYRIFNFSRLSDLIEVKAIQEVDHQGFSTWVYRKRKGEMVTYYWKDVQQVVLDEDRNLLVSFYAGKDLKVERGYSNWYKFIQSIPQSKLVGDQIPSFITQFSQELETCPICGTIALHEECCLSCGHDVFDEELAKEYPSEAEYIREEQLDLFATESPEEKVNFYEEEDDGFQRDPHWKPVVTEEEVMAHSREHWWE